MKDTDTDVRNYAALAIGKTRSVKALQPLLKVLEEDKSDRVKNSAAASLEKIGKPVVEPLMNILEGTEDISLTIRIVQVLGNIRDKRADEPLDKIYQETTNTLLRNETAKALNKLRS